MKLAELLTDAATLDARTAALEVARRHGRQPRGQARRRVRRGGRAPRPTACASRRRPWRRAPRRSSARAAPPSLPAGAAFVQVANARRALALAAARFYPRQPDDDRRRHRHQRQDLGRRLHAPDLGGARPCGRQHRHHRRGDAEARGLRLADHARSGRAASHARRARRRGRHASGASKRRRTASTSTGSTACASRPAPSPISAATISIIIRRSRPISRPSCGCSRRWWPTAARR